MSSRQSKSRRGSGASDVHDGFSSASQTLEIATNEVAFNIPPPLPLGVGAPDPRDLLVSLKHFFCEKNHKKCILIN